MNGRAPPLLEAGSDPRRALGRLGEELAVNRLRRLGFQILERNARTRHGEIDVIAFDGTTLVFVEVKTRRVCRQVIGLEDTPLMALEGRKQARVRRLAASWLHDHRGSRPRSRTIRFDAVGVIVDGAGALRRLEHIPGAW